MDDLVVGDGRDRHGLLYEPIKEFASALRTPAVEAERELVQVVVEVFVADCSLVSSQQPSLQQGDDAMHARHQFRWSLLVSFEKRDVVQIAGPF